MSRALPISDGLMAALKTLEGFAQQETMVRGIPQQLEKEHALGDKTAPKSTAHKFRVGDRVLVLRSPPMGTHRTKDWFRPR